MTSRGPHPKPLLGKSQFKEHPRCKLGSNALPKSDIACICNEESSLKILKGLKRDLVGEGVIINLAAHR